MEKYKNNKKTNNIVLKSKLDNKVILELSCKNHFK